MNTYIGKQTHVGRSGKNQEDNYGVKTIPLRNGDMAYLAVVADGIGGNAAGEVASEVAVRTAQEEFSEEDMRSVEPALERILTRVNEAIYQLSQSNPQYTNMGTTMALALVAEGQVHTASIGDSRVYLLHNGKPEQLTVDHTWIQEAVSAGRLTPQEAAIHPNRHVLKRFLGINENIEVDDKVLRPPHTFKQGDSLVLCTDGLTDLVSAQEIQKIVSSENAQEAADQLVELANEKGGHDNITTIVIKTTEGPVQ